jgi:DNA-binding PadR family transcriptional regulator
VASDSLTTTSCAILALLAVQDWSSYELAQQMGRSVDWFWPRAESVVYEEPKRLVRLGLAKAKTQYTGRRKRTVYSITPAGRRAVKRWLDAPGDGPQLRFEKILQVAFADLGTKDQLVRTLGSINSDAHALATEVRSRIDEYGETGGPFPERLHVISLVARFLSDYATMVRKWSSWALEAVDDWDDTMGETPPHDALRPPR